MWEVLIFFLQGFGEHPVPRPYSQSWACSFLSAKWCQWLIKHTAFQLNTIFFYPLLSSHTLPLSLSLSSWIYGQCVADSGLLYSAQAHELEPKFTYIKQISVEIHPSELVSWHQASSSCNTGCKLDKTLERMKIYSWILRNFRVCEHLTLSNKCIYI